MPHDANGHPLAAAISSPRELDDLRLGLDTMPVIEQAKGILVGHYRIDPDAAFAVLRRWSMNGNIKVATLASSLVEMASTGSVARSPAAMLGISSGSPPPVDESRRLVPS